MEWLLNYRGGSFLIDHYQALEQECTIRGVTYQAIADGQAAISCAEMRPRGEHGGGEAGGPQDGRVRPGRASSHGTTPYHGHGVRGDILRADLCIRRVVGAAHYDWLHLPTRDFTGQYGKFWRSYRNAAWYQEMVRGERGDGRVLGGPGLEMKLGVA